MTNPHNPLSERVLILAPHGRDAELARALLHDADLPAQIVADLPALVAGLVDGAGAVLMTEEAVRTADLASISNWIAGQPHWSDMPFILLTRQGGGIDRNPAAARLSRVLGNVSFLERPFHPTTLISVVVTALRGRRRQYEARARLDELRSGEERLQFALEAGGMGAWVLELQGFVLTASDHCRANFGFAPGSAFTYADLRSVIHPDDRERMDAAVHSAVAGHQDYEIEYRIVYPRTGEVRWVAIRGRPIYGRDGIPLRMAGVSSDVTQRKLAQEALRDSEERLRLATEHAEVGFWDVDPLRDVLVWPPRVKAMFGISADAPVTMQDFYDGLHPEDRPATAEAYRAATDPARRALYDIEYRTVGKEDGLVRWVAAKGRGVFDEGGSCVRVLGTAVDVTGRKAIEERLREFSETLERRVEEEVAERTKAEDALRQAQKMEAVGQLTGGVAHDFNNLLTIIRSSVDFLRRPELPEERRRRYMDAVSDTVDRAAKLTGQLLAFARRQALKPETFEAGMCLSGVADMLDTVTGARIHVDLQLPEMRCFIRCDRSQFETALVNMAVNARDAMDGAGTLTLRLVADRPMPPIRGHAPSRSAFVAVSLTDSGAGIAPDDLRRIFEPFFTTKEVGKGTGLGLSQVFGFAKQSGGDVDVESTLGRGTTFTLFLPQVDAPAEDCRAIHVAEEASDGAGRRVLVVEDNVEVGRFATQILQDLGYEPEWAANAEAALERLAGDGADFDAIFSDVVMPGMGGIALAMELRRRLPSLPVVLASGYSHVLAEEGSHGFELLHKPYSAEQLSRVLRRIITGRIMERAPGEP